MDDNKDWEVVSSNDVRSLTDCAISFLFSNNDDDGDEDVLSVSFFTWITVNVIASSSSSWSLLLLSSLSR